MIISTICPHCKHDTPVDIEETDPYSGEINELGYRVEECENCNTPYALLIVWQPVIVEMYTLQHVDPSEGEVVA